MKGKSLKLNKFSKIAIMAIGFVLTIVLTASATLAWFYDKDWASKTVTMGGAVGIEMRDSTPAATSGAGQLHFNIQGNYAYPGQAIDVEASVFNNGGSSIINYFKETEGDDYEYSDDEIKEAGQLPVGSSCYVRAHFTVYTNIGSDSSDDDSAAFNSDKLLEALIDLIREQNDNEEYYWQYYRNTNAVCNLEGNYYYNGKTSHNGDTLTDTSEVDDEGYFYLCKPDKSTLFPLIVGETAVFLWDNRLIIPWQLTNASADKTIFVALSFQAIQTFIPQIDDGVIYKGDIDNQLAAEDHTYNNTAVQTVFNTCNFSPINTVVGGVDYATAEGFKKATAHASLSMDPPTPPAGS